MASARKLLVVVVLMLPLLVLASPQVRAQTGGQCDAGEIVDGLCVIDHGPPTCPAAYEADGVVSCVQVVPPTTDAACPDGTLGEPGDCHVFVPQVAVQTCEVGDLVGDACVFRSPAPTRCPDGYVADASLGGICARFENAEQMPASCPDGARGVPGGCYILVAKGPGSATCEVGELVGSTCVIQGEPPVNGPATCPVSATVLEVDGRCFTLVFPLGDGSCPPESTPNGDGLCERAIALVPGALICEPTFGLVDGDCIRFEAATIVPAECPAGSVEDAAGDCRKPVADQAGAFFCSDPNAALNGSSCVFTAGFEFGPCAEGSTLDGDECVVVLEPSISLECPEGSQVDGELCRQLVADIVGDPFCVDEDAELTELGCVLRADAECEVGELIGETCVESFPIDFFCAGELVTINMQLGDPGVGTPGPDVILGTTGPDTIDAGAGDDLVCALSGDDTVLGGSGADVLFGNGGHDTMRGGSGDDKVAGGSGDDDLSGGGGNDSIYGQAGIDALRGGNGRDVLRGGTGGDDLRGGDDNDRLKGQAGHDRLRGDAGFDRCDGGVGIDTAVSGCEVSTRIP